MAKKAIAKYGFRVRDEDIALVQEGDVLEIYSTVAEYQMFRNLEFFNYCRYSLLEVMTNEWYNLFERASFVEKDLYAWLGEMIQAGRSLPSPLGEHFMREKLLDKRRLIAVKFKYMIPLFAQDEDRIEAVLLTSQARLVMEDEAPENLRFI